MKNLLLQLNELDYAILAVIFISLVVGVFRGFLREVISLVTWFLAFFAALRFAPVVAGLFDHAISNSMGRYIVSSVIIFLIIMILGIMINKLSQGLLTITGLGFFNRVLGFIFGSARGVLLVVIALLIIGLTPFQKENWYQHSSLTPHLQPWVQYFNQYVPKEFQSATTWIEKMHTTIKNGIDGNKNAKAIIDKQVTKTVNP